MTAAVPGPVSLVDAHLAAALPELRAIEGRLVAALTPAMTAEDPSAPAAAVWQLVKALGFLLQAAGPT